MTIDAAWQFDLTPPQSDGLTRDTVVTFDHAPAPDGTRLVPDLAISIPTPTNDGRTYRFQLRPNIRYSDGRLVKAADFRRGMERLLKLRTPNAGLYRAIVGADRCDSSATCSLARGIVTDDRTRTVTYRLAHADPLFLSNLANLSAAPVPPGTPLGSGDLPGQLIPGTGPYRVASADSHEITYVRNAFFHEWSHAAQPEGNPDKIVMRFGLTAEQETRQVASGRADWMAEAVPATLLSAMARRYGTRLRTFAITETDYFRFNTAEAPFIDVRARRALNLALDRRRVVATYGGSLVASPTCQVLPPGIVGFERYCPYTAHASSDGRWRSPDLTRGRQLVRASGTYGASVALWGWTDDPTISPLVVHEVARALRELGYRPRVRLVPHSYFQAGAHPDALFGIDLLPAGWLDITPTGFFESLIVCSAPLNQAFCDRRVDGLVRRAQRLASSDPAASAAAWAAADRLTVDDAAWLPLVNSRQIDFVSPRVRNFQHHPYWDVLVDQLWISGATK